MTPFDPILHFSLELDAIRLRAKLEVSSYNRPRDIRGSQNFNIGSRENHVTLFDPILNFFRWRSPPSVCVPNLKFLASTVREILEVSKNFKIGSRDPPWPLSPNFECFSFELTAVRLREKKFEVFSFNRSRSIRGVLKYQIWSRDPPITPFDPILHFFR